MLSFHLFSKEFSWLYNLGNTKFGAESQPLRAPDLKKEGQGNVQIGNGHYKAIKPRIAPGFYQKKS